MKKHLKKLLSPGLQHTLIGLKAFLTGNVVQRLAVFQSAVRDKRGLEIGGPSGVFQDYGILPIYRSVSSLDNCVFSGKTLWEGERQEGWTYEYYKDKPKGFNFIREATLLQGIGNESYDFILGSHCLEHIANPIAALKEWQRVMVASGSLIVIVPHYRYTFDHRRSPTPLLHMLEDWRRDTDESDATHKAEILACHDITRDPGAGNWDKFLERSMNNFENRCFHHHVFDETNSRELLEAAGLKVWHMESVKPHHIVLLASR